PWGGTRLLTRRLAVTGGTLNAHSPAEASDVAASEYAGSSPAKVAVKRRWGELRAIGREDWCPRNAVMSVGVQHATPPSQYDDWLVAGGPPLRISASLESAFVSQSPVKPGRRGRPVSRVCMVPCLMARFLAMRRCSAAISASASDSAVAMARCSAFVGG